MPKYEIAVEFKSGHLTRPQLQQIVTAAIQARPDIDEIIVRCTSAARTALAMAREYSGRIKAFKNRAGRNVRVTLAIGRLES